MLNESKTKAKTPIGYFKTSLKHSSKSLNKHDGMDPLHFTTATKHYHSNQIIVCWSLKCAARLKIVEMLKDPNDEIHLLTTEQMHQKHATVHKLNLFMTNYMKLLKEFGIVNGQETCNLEGVEINVVFMSTSGKRFVNFTIFSDIG